MGDDLSSFVRSESQLNGSFKLAWDATRLAQTVGAEIRSLRSAAGLSVAALSAAAEVSESALMDLEHGLDIDVTILQLYRISALLGRELLVTMALGQAHSDGPGAR